MQKLLKLIIMLFVTCNLNAVKEEQQVITSIHQTWNNVESFLGAPRPTLCRHLNIPSTLKPFSSYSEYLLQTMFPQVIVNAMISPALHAELYDKIITLVPQDQLVNLLCQAIRIHLNNLRRDGASRIGFANTDTAASYPIKSSDTGELLGIELYLSSRHSLHPIAKEDKSFSLTGNTEWIKTQVFFVENNQPEVLGQLNQGQQTGIATHKLTIITTWHLGYQRFGVYDDLTKFYEDKRYRGICMRVLVVNANPQDQ